MSTTDIWAWIYKDTERLDEAGGRKEAIADGWRAFWRFYHDDYAAAQTAISSAIADARAEGEREWELLMRHWRVQHMLKDDVRRALPEAIDLLGLAVEDRVKHVPQRICAFHDVVYCYTAIDGAGYYDDIAANADDVLAQVSSRHSCADCARINCSLAAAQAGHTDEALQRLRQFNAHRATSDMVYWLTNTGEIHEALGRWDDAEAAFREVVQKAREAEKSDDYLEGLLGLARALAAKGDVPDAGRALHEARHMAKYTGRPTLLARMPAVEGYLAVAEGEFAQAVAYFSRAARAYADLGRARTAVRLGLEAAELARAHGLPEPADALDAAARAAGELAPGTHDLPAQLAIFGRAPVPAHSGLTGTVAGPADPDAAEAERATREREALRADLDAHVATGNAQGVATTLYRLARWHGEHDEPRAAVEYLILNGILERLLRLGMNDREDALNALRHLEESLPAGAIESAFVAAQAGPPELLSPVVGQMSVARWAWVARAVRSEWRNEPVIEPEPEPEEEDGDDGGFDAWLDHVAGMTTLIVRFRDRADPTARERWASMLDETRADITKRMTEAEDERQAEGGRALQGLVAGLTALAREGDPEQVAAATPLPFDGVLRQIVALAGRPVFAHPGMWPLDYLLEDTSRRAVRGLRRRDEHREGRLLNLAFRCDLLTFDLLEDEDFAPVVAYLRALAATLRATAGGDDEAVPAEAATLEAPFDAMLAAVRAAGRVPMPVRPRDDA